MIDAILGGAWPWLLAVGGFIVALVSAYFKGRNTQRTKQKLKDLENYVETTQRMGETPLNTNADAARERLRNRPKR